MKAAAQTTFAERMGRTLGWLWRGCVRLDRRAAQALVAKGWEPGAASTVLWVVKAVAFSFLLYSAFWIALLFVFTMAGAWLLRNDDGSYDKEHNSEWRYGHAGYGLYSYDGHRIDPHDPEDEEN